MRYTHTHTHIYITHTHTCVWKWKCSSLSRVQLFCLPSLEGYSPWVTKNWTFTFILNFPDGWASLMAQMVKNLPAVGETQVWSLDWEDPLEKGLATHASILAWRISWTLETGGLQAMELQWVKYDCVTNTHTWTFTYIYIYIHIYTQNHWELYG